MNTLYSDLIEVTELLNSASEMIAWQSNTSGALGKFSSPPTTKEINDLLNKIDTVLSTLKDKYPDINFD